MKRRTERSKRTLCSAQMQFSEKDYEENYDGDYYKRCRENCKKSCENSKVNRVECEDNC